MTEQKVKKEMKIDELIDNFPDVVPLLMSYGLHCVGCTYSSIDTLESGAKMHGMGEKDVEMMVKDCNRLLEELEE